MTPPKPGVSPTKHMTRKNTWNEIEILRQAMLIGIGRHCWTNRASADQTQITADCDKGKLSTTKRLIASQKYQDIVRHIEVTLAWVAKRTMQSTIRKGVYFVRRDTVDEVCGYIDAQNSHLRDVLVPDFCATEYEPSIEAASKPASEGGLGVLFNRDDYPAKDDMPHRFGIDYSLFALSIPDELPAEVYAKESAKLRQSFAEAQDEVKFALREGVKQFVDDAANQLTGGKKFNSKTVKKLDKFFDTFHARNMTDDKALEDLVEQARKAVRGIDLKMVGKDGLGRASVAKQFSAVAAEVEKLLVDRPKRKFRFDE